MKVKDLIEQLQTLDPELLVLGDGYEGGLKELKHVRVVEIALNVNNKWYYGPHELYEEGLRGTFDRAKGVTLS